MSDQRVHAVSSQIEEQYLHVDEIARRLGDIDISDLELVRMDSYSDSAICKSVKETGMEKELLCSAIQTAIVGTGNKRYGSVVVNNEVVDIEGLYDKCGVKTKLNLGVILQPGDMTGRRLQRFFRKQISEYIKKTGASSYLWRKYSDHDDKYKHIVFPGAEHLVENNDEMLYLFKTYVQLDARLNTRISERIERVLNARGYLVSRDAIAS
jgi:hypothetical protein